MNFICFIKRMWFESSFKYPSFPGDLLTCCFKKKNRTAGSTRISESYHYLPLWSPLTLSWAHSNHLANHLDSSTSRRAHQSLVTHGSTVNVLYAFLCRTGIIDRYSIMSSALSRCRVADTFSCTREKLSPNIAISAFKATTRITVTAITNTADTRNVSFASYRMPFS